MVERPTFLRTQAVQSRYVVINEFAGMETLIRSARTDRIDR
jgi:hypothetical protein